MRHDAIEISIVIPLYNKEGEISRALRSVLAQTVTSFELLVVNDGSTDRGPKIARDIRDPRIRIIDQGNAGVSAARNHGIAEAKADLIAFLDADDEWMPDFLETILRLRERFSSCKVFATRYFFCSSNGQQRPATVRGLPAGFSDGLMHSYFDIASISDPPLCASAIAVKKEALMEIGSFPVGIASGEDLLTWARLATRYDIAYNNEPKAFFWGPIRVSDRPGRVPNKPDFVGDELVRLMESADPAKSAGLRRYLSLWHRMRAVIFIQLGDRRNALEEIRVAMSFASSIRLFLLLLIAMLPGFLPAKVLLSIKRIKASY